VYRKETTPLLEFYRARRTLVEVDGVGTADEVFQRVLAGLEAL
jgi:adenylate kinase